MEIKKHLSLLGLKVEDKVTGFTGVVATVSFDLYGCVQVIVKPPINENGESREGNWYDVSRLKILNKKPVMDVPNFEYGIQAEGKQGATSKPAKKRRLNLAWSLHVS